METQGVATRGIAAEILRLHGQSGPHMLQLALLDSENVIFTYAIRDQGAIRVIAGDADAYSYESDSGYDRDGSTQTFTGQTLTAPVEPGSVWVEATTDAPILYDSEKDGVLYAQVAARKIGAAGSWASMATESFVVSFDGNPNETVTFTTQTSIAAAVIAINAILLNGTAVARDANNIDLVGNVVGEGGSVQVVSADAAVTTKIGISVGTVTNAWGTIDYFTGELEIVYTNGYTPSPGGSADAATLTGTVAGSTFNMAPGDTLVADINNTSDKTATFDAAQSTLSGRGGSFAASSSETMSLKVDGGEAQTIALTAGGETTIATYVSRLNAVMLGCHAVANTNSIGGCVGKVNELKADWNAHVIDATAHTNADAGNVTAVTDATLTGVLGTDITSCETLFDDIKAKMNAHLIAVSEEEEAVTLCSELRADYILHCAEESHEEECVDLVNECRTSFIAHMAMLASIDECYLVLNELQTIYNAHRIDTAVAHDNADGVNASAAGAATTFATAVTLSTDLNTQLSAHYTQATVHPTNDTFHAITATDPATTVAELVTLTNDIQTQYAAHIADGANNVHKSPDITNVVTEAAADTTATHLEKDITNTIGAAATDYATSYTLASDIYGKYNNHRTDANNPAPPGSQAAGWHATDDDANTLTTAPDPATTPAELVATLTEMKADLNKHFANTGGSYHQNADATNTITEDLPGTAAIHSIDNTTDTIAAGDPTTLANCYTVSDQFKTAFNNHIVDNTDDCHPTNDTNNGVTAAGTPTTLDLLKTLLDDEKAMMNQHLANTGGAYHINADSTNTISAVAMKTAAVHEIDDTTNTIGGSSDTTLGTLLTNLTELQTDYNAHRTQATIHDANDTTNVSARTDDSIDLVSDTYGTDSGVQVVSGDAAFLELTGIRAETATVGTGDVGNINAVTHAEIKALVEEDIKTATAGDLVVVTESSDHKVVLTTVATGASAEIDLNTSNAATVLGLSLTAVVGVAATADPTNLLVDYVRGVSRAGPGRYVERIPNLPDGAELIIYGIGQAGSCRVRAALEQMRV